MGVIEDLGDLPRSSPSEPLFRWNDFFGTLLDLERGKVDPQGRGPTVSVVTPPTED